RKKSSLLSCAKTGIGCCNTLLGCLSPFDLKRNQYVPYVQTRSILSVDGNGERRLVCTTLTVRVCVCLCVIRVMFAEPWIDNFRTRELTVAPVSNKIMDFSPST
ncbi:hypothetical protein M5D96_010805, partial [Drosophila gunungcola]